ncbi:unnamed protein product [Colias eurytheme]|nr:unnamed protein product [Colias eurytheme]
MPKSVVSRATRTFTDEIGGDKSYWCQLRLWGVAESACSAYRRHGLWAKQIPWCGVWAMSLLVKLLLTFIAATGTEYIFHSQSTRMHAPSFSDINVAQRPE